MSNHVSHQNTALLPESTTIGMLGSGQLGRMFTFAAHRMGYRVHVLSPTADSPAGRVADRDTVANYDDHDALIAFAESVDVVTLEFENIPVDSLRLIEAHIPVRPGPYVLETSQHRIREKSALSHAGIPVADFCEINSAKDLTDCLTGANPTHSFPSILKTAAWGYDGKGQTRIESAADISKAWHVLGCDAAILEAFVEFECELSVVAARSRQGQVACYEPIRNEHCNHILDVSLSPSGLPKSVTESAKTLAADILETLDVVGVMCVEMFLTRDQQLLVNELAPRPHNSGHLTIESHATSQFEQQVRAVCGLPLGSTTQIRPAAMVNLLGELWSQGQPNFARVAALESAHLHLYGKVDPKPGRKMGHITALADDVTDARELARKARNELTPQTSDSPTNASVNEPNQRTATGFAAP